MRSASSASRDLVLNLQRDTLERSLASMQHFVDEIRPLDGVTAVMRGRARRAGGRRPGPRRRAPRLSSSLVIRVRVVRQGRSIAAASSASACVQDEAVQQAAVVLRDRPGAGRHAELGHHLGGRALDGAPADDRRHRHHRRAAGGDGGAQARHREDRVDADERVRRADHHRLEALGSERLAERRRRPRRAGALETRSRCTFGAQRRSTK